MRNNLILNRFAFFHFIWLFLSFYLWILSLFIHFQERLPSDSTIMSPLSKNVKSAYLNVFISHKDAGRRINNRGMKLTFCYLFVWDDFVFTLELKWLAVKTFDCSLADSFFFFFFPFKYLSGLLSKVLVWWASTTASCLLVVFIPALHLFWRHFLFEDNPTKWTHEATPDKNYLWFSVTETSRNVWLHNRRSGRDALGIA